MFYEKFYTCPIFVPDVFGEHPFEPESMSSYFGHDDQDVIVGYRTSVEIHGTSLSAERYSINGIRESHENTSSCFPGCTSQSQAVPLKDGLVVWLRRPYPTRIHAHRIGCKHFSQYSPYKLFPEIVALEQLATCSHSREATSPAVRLPVGLS